MFKKQFMLVLLTLLAVMSASAATWKMHNTFVSSAVKNIYDIGNKVYYVDLTTLFVYDKTTQTTTALSKQNVLSDNMVSQIYFDNERRLLFVAYANSNIDVIDETGKVTNINNIKDVIPHVHNCTLDDGELANDATYTTKTINDITFADGIAYVAIGYGYVTIDENTLTVKESFELVQNNTVYSVAVVGDKMLLLTSSYLYCGPKNQADPIHTYAKKSISLGESHMCPINDSTFFALTTLGVYRYSMTDSLPMATKLIAQSQAPIVISAQKSHSGYIINLVNSSKKLSYYTTDATGNTATQVSSTSLASSDPAGDGSVWLFGTDGLYISGTSSYHSINGMTMSVPFWMKYSAAMNKLYVGSTARNMWYNKNGSYTNVVNTYDGANWRVATAYSTPNGYEGYEFVFDPFDPYTYVRASWTKGIFKVTNDVMKKQFTSSNSNIGTYKAHPAFDNYGNLWAVSSYGYPTAPVVVLPKAKYDNPASVAKTDWFAPSGMLNVNTGRMQASKFIISKKNNVKMYTDGDYPSTPYMGHIMCWDNGNEDPTVDNYQFVSLGSFLDQNNKSVDWTYIRHMEEDNDGMIWVGTMSGLFYFDPNEVFSERPRAVRPYVTKFDEGKGNLCEGYEVYDIGVDRENNKWIATNGNGLFFVSPDGSEVYKHFITENSDIPGNIVYTVECDTVNNRVYIITDNGFAEYIADGDAATLDYNSVYAYPNPVEPDFTGMIKITGLMENTRVIITNSEGGIITTMGPVMGSALWDGTGSNGERVPTGIYKVYVFQDGQSFSLGGEPATTIMVIQ